MRWWDGSQWTPTLQPTHKPPKKKMGCLPVLMIGAAVVIGLGVIGSAFGGGSDYEEDSPDRPAAPREFSQFTAEIFCEDKVREMLKSPSTADFPDTTATREQGGAFDVRGVVDSQNSFGATVRSTFGCTVTPINADQARVTVDELTGR